MKQYIHLLAPITLWAIGLALYIVTLNNTLPKRVDSIKTYRLQKRPHSYEDALYNMKEAFVRNWPTDACFGPINVTADPTCLATRTDLSTSILAAMECTTYTSQACKCIEKITVGLTSSTGSIAKDLRGKKDDTVYAIDSCKLLMHNAHTAVFSGKVWAQKTAMLFLILSIVLGNAVDWILVNQYIESSQWDGFTASIIKIVNMMVWAFVPMIVSVSLDFNTLQIYLYTIVPPLIILFLYESYKGSYYFPEYPFIHPYTFACVLGILTFLANAEAGILDNDILIVEIVKCNIAAYIYLQAVWKYMIKHTEKDYSKSKFVEDGTLRAILLVFTLYVVGTMPPYPTACTFVMMWYTPFLWVVLAFASVLWVCSFDYERNFGDKVKAIRTKYGKWDLLPASQHVATIVLIYVSLLVLYYLRENSTVFADLVDKYPINTLQYNTTTSWMRPPTLVSRL